MSSSALPKCESCVTTRVAPAGARSLRVVIIDDEPGIVATWTAILQASGFEAEGHTEVAAAMDAIARGCDCVVTDYHMPQMSGVELIRAARQASPAKFILITANTSNEVAEEAMRAGAACVLHKPTLATSVLQKIVQLCRE